jgi:hypothetical protein
MLNFAIQPGRIVLRCSEIRSLAAIVLIGLSVGACSSAGPALSSLPKELGGLPENTPARPTTQLAYPAVHDMPPPRAAPVMTPEQVKATEAELTAVRDGQPNGPSAKAKKDRKKQEN